MTEIKLLNKKLFSAYARAIFGARVSPDLRKNGLFQGQVPAYNKRLMASVVPTLE